jgi:hypothetical protein
MTLRLVLQRYQVRVSAILQPALTKGSRGFPQPHYATAETVSGLLLSLKIKFVTSPAVLTRALHVFLSLQANVGKLHLNKPRPIPYKTICAVLLAALTGLSRFSSSYIYECWETILKYATEFQVNLGRDIDFPNFVQWNARIVRKIGHDRLQNVYLLTIHGPFPVLFNAIIFL